MISNPHLRTDEDAGVSKYQYGRRDVLWKKNAHLATFSQYLNTISRGSGKTASGNTSWIAFFSSDSKTAMGSLESSPHLTAHAFQANDS